MSIEHIQNMACFLQRFITFFSGRSGHGPIGPVQKILVVRSGPEGPQFARSVGTLVLRSIVSSDSFRPSKGVKPFFENKIPSDSNLSSSSQFCSFMIQFKLDCEPFGQRKIVHLISVPDQTSQEGNK